MTKVSARAGTLGRNVPARCTRQQTRIRAHAGRIRTVVAKTERPQAKASSLAKASSVDGAQASLPFTTGEDLQNVYIPPAAAPRRFSPTRRSDVSDKEGLSCDSGRSHGR